MQNRHNKNGRIYPLSAYKYPLWTNLLSLSPTEIEVDAFGGSPVSKTPTDVLTISLRVTELMTLQRSLLQQLHRLEQERDKLSQNGDDDALHAANAYCDQLEQLFLKLQNVLDEQELIPQAGIERETLENPNSPEQSGQT